MSGGGACLDGATTFLDFYKKTFTKTRKACLRHAGCLGVDDVHIVLLGTDWRSQRVAMFVEKAKNYNTKYI